MAEEIEVAIPDGVGEGMAMNIEYNGMAALVTVPAGYGPGMVLKVKMAAVNVAVPAGMGPGMQMNVEWAGQMNTVVIPDGVGEGMLMTVAFAVPEGIDDSQIADIEAHASMVAMHEDDAAKLGAGLAANEGDDGPIASTAVEDPNYVGHNQMAAPLYAIGSRMQVLRSDESYSPCTIIAATPTAMGPVYDVQLDDGNTKSGIAEDTLIA